MIFWLLDVKSTVTVNGKDVAFDYINTYYEENDALKEAKLLSENDVISFGNHKFTIIETPGHSRGSVCYYCSEENVLFSGDTLFHMSIGRTDFKGGSMMQIIQSLRHLAQLPDETVVLPGHDVQTTIGEELAHNPYMDR